MGSLRSTGVPSLLSSLLQRTRKVLLVLLLVVLPLQGVMQLVAGVQGQRHLHTGDAPAAAPVLSLASIAQPLRALLDHLHAAQKPRFSAPALSRGAAAGLHAHGDVFHEHAHDTGDVVEVGDPADDSLQGGATAFLAWLPAAWLLPAGEGLDRPPRPASIGATASSPRR